MLKIIKVFFEEYSQLSSRALNYSLFTVGSQLLFTPLVILLVTTKMSADAQGYYYTFLSLIALQSFFELGLFTYVTNKSSALYADLVDFNIQYLEASGRIRSDLGMLYRMIKKLYFLISSGFFICVGCFGLVFFANSAIYDFNEIQLYWLCLCALCSIQLYYLGFNSFLEGCQQIEQTEKLKLIAFIFSSVILIASLYFNLGLISLCLSFIPRVMKDVYLVHFLFGKEFKLIAKAKSTRAFSFMKSVAPMQFRLAISGVFSYLQYNAFVPIVFSVLGPAQAGAVGVGLQITSFAQQILIKWTYINQPRMSKLASLQEFSALDTLVKDIQGITIKLSVIFMLGFVLLFLTLKVFEFQPLERIPEISVFLLLLSAAGAYAQVSIRVGYLRAFVEERAHIMSMTIALVNVTLCYLLLESTGVYAVPLSYFVTIFLVALPWSQALVAKKRLELKAVINATNHHEFK